MKSLKLNQIEKNVLSTNEMNEAKGGQSARCRCSCYYRYTGGSGLNANGNANWNGYLYSYHITNDMLIYRPDGTEFWGRDSIVK